VLKPVATTYTQVVPSLVRRGIGNFFNNFADAWSAVNNLLQGKVERGLQDVMRVGINTVFGLGGVLDVASEAGMDHYYEDFGQTLGHWGVGAGPYIVLPLLGPSTLRETAALPVDRSVGPTLAIDSGTAQAGLTALQIVNVRAELLGASRLLDGVALDKYNFVRDAYLQRRRSQVYDGDPPPLPEEAEPPEPADKPADKPSAAPGANKK
jgi:phospholipid-binding lipoprotein MlaA